MPAEKPEFRREIAAKNKSNGGSGEKPLDIRKKRRGKNQVADAAAGKYDYFPTRCAVFCHPVPGTLKSH
jgi:hypothetical protein